MDKNNPWIKRFERERAAKKEAEKLLEDKSLELYNANLSLEQKVKERTLELQQALQEAHIAQKAKDTFLSSMSHELRTPLNAIIGFSQILSKQEDVPPKIKVFVDKIYLSGNTLLRLINTILNFSKIESENIQINKEAIQAKSFISEILILIETQLEEKNITLKSDLDESLFMADKQLMHQAILNILSNAVKFTHPNGEISISAKKLHERFVITISDNGIGISEENQTKLFEPFTQVQNEYQAKINGTGLGLYLTYKIVQLHAGEITLESKLGQGSCFRIFI
ncbi:MAG: HAMP domain-containing sensor histidine kinase [Sulfurimonas sp.]|nr:HAMP domain-containing sensor histidine kinase [Sulfurimonas sp.]MDD3060410.1 HAMP domain-containing sensor histidine kinase [Sulfurimonas sp.]MDD5202571.1 HAMP domain-containing sensor histidine kinase [Sulfurimonas sp.]